MLSQKLLLSFKQVEEKQKFSKKFYLHFCFKHVRKKLNDCDTQSALSQTISHLLILNIKRIWFHIFNVFAVVEHEENF